VAQQVASSCKGTGFTCATAHLSLFCLGIFEWSGPRPGGLTLRQRDSWGTEVRGWSSAISVLTRLAACKSVSAKAKRKTDVVCACGNVKTPEQGCVGSALPATAAGSGGAAGQLLLRGGGHQVAPRTKARVLLQLRLDQGGQQASCYYEVAGTKSHQGKEGRPFPFPIAAGSAWAVATHLLRAAPGSASTWHLST
jgi:hypothetical protein